MKGWCSIYTHMVFTWLFVYRKIGVLHYIGPILIFTSIARCELHTLQHSSCRNENMIRWFTSLVHLHLSSCVTAQHQVCHIHQSHNLQQKGGFAYRFTLEQWTMLIICNTLTGWQRYGPTSTDGKEHSSCATLNRTLVRWVYKRLVLQQNGTQ